MNQNAVRELARQIVVRTAPKEAEQFDSRADAWFSDPAQARSGSARPGAPLGSGFAAALPTIVPAALYVADHVMSAVTEVTVEEGVKRAWARFRRSKRAESKAAESPDSVSAPEDADEQALDKQKVIEAYDGDAGAMHAAALAAGEQFGADPNQVILIADQVVFIFFAAGPSS